MEETQVRVKLWDINNPNAKQIHHRVAEMMVLDYQLLLMWDSVVFSKQLRLGTKFLVGSIF